MSEDLQGNLGGAPWLGYLCRDIILFFLVFNVLPWSTQEFPVPVALWSLWWISSSPQELSLMNMKSHLLSGTVSSHGNCIWNVCLHADSSFLISLFLTQHWFTVIIQFYVTSPSSCASSVQVAVSSKQKLTDDSVSKNALIMGLKLTHVSTKQTSHLFPAQSKCDTPHSSHPSPPLWESGKTGLAGSPRGQQNRRCQTNQVSEQKFSESLWFNNKSYI